VGLGWGEDGVFANSSLVIFPLCRPSTTWSDTKDAAIRGGAKEGRHGKNEIRTSAAPVLSSGGGRDTTLVWGGGGGGRQSFGSEKVE